MGKGSEMFKQRIKAHLDAMAAQDAAFAARYANPGKSIDRCADYVIAWVEKQQRCGFDDCEIYGQAVHYYDEENVGNVSHRDCRIVIDEAVELTEDEKADARKQAMERMIANEIERMRKKPTAKKSVPAGTTQPTLF